MAAALPWIITAASTVLTAKGQREEGKAAKAHGILQRQLNEKAAKEEAASKQRTALDERRKAKLLVSRAIAVAAAGGGSVSDPTVANIIADIEGEGAYRANVAMYEGEAQAEKLRTEGKIAEYEGRQKYKASRYKVGGTILSGAGKGYAQYTGAYG